VGCGLIKTMGYASAVIAFSCALLAGCGAAVAGIPRVSARDPCARVRGVADEYIAAYEQMFPDLAEYYGKTLARHDALPDNSHTLGHRAENRPSKYSLAREGEHAGRTG
jgi:hypothetical protein